MAERSQYDVVAVGSSFATSFFLHTYLQSAPPHARVLVLERGLLEDSAWQLENRENSSLNSNDTFINGTPQKPWRFTLNFGGSSNCWWACTPRFMPNDFRMQSTYGVGVDWPLTYEELMPFYDRAEQLMEISGPSDGSPYPRSKPYPQPPHRLSAPDLLLKQAFPNEFFVMPSARARVDTDTRAACCASSICHLCPVDAKFTIENGMASVFKDPRVTLEVSAQADHLRWQGSSVQAIEYHRDGRQHTVAGDLFLLGANAIFNPFLMLKSGIDHPLLGKYLHEQVSLVYNIDLDGLDNYQGSTSLTGHGYMHYDGPHRRERAGCLIETINVPTLRPERGKWRQRAAYKLIFEDLPSEASYVGVAPQDPTRPITVYGGISAYAEKSLAMADDLLKTLVAPLPVENIEKPKQAPTEAHILGTTRMGNDLATSVLDKHLVHHQLRNLVVLGSGAFPHGGPANPTLTLSALSLWSAHHLTS